MWMMWRRPGWCTWGSWRASGMSMRLWWLVGGSGRRGRVWRDANGWSVAIHDGMRRCAGEWWGHALSITFELVPQHVDFPAHVLVALLEVDNEVDGCDAMSSRIHSRATRIYEDAPLLRISHLLAFIPRSAGSWSRNSSNSSFISFLRLRSASLCDMRSSGEREYGVDPDCFSDEVRPGEASSGFALPPAAGWAALAADGSAPRTREGGRERDLSARVGPVAGGVGRASGGMVGADIRRSAKETGGMTVVRGSKGGGACILTACSFCMAGGTA